MKIVRALFVPGSSSFYFDDQKAIKSGAPHDGAVYGGKPETPGFKAVRVAGEAVSILLLLENGSWAVGDCAAVQYSGAGGRDPLFLAADYLPLLERRIRPLLEGAEVGPFRDMAAQIRSPGVRRPAAPYGHPLRPVPGPAPRPGPCQPEDHG